MTIPTFQEPPAPAPGVPAESAPKPTPPVQGAAGDLGPNGFPLNTPWRDMPAEQQAAYWQFQAKKHEGTAKSAQQQVAEMKPLADQYRSLEEASRTEQERAVDQARKDAAAAARAEADADALSKFGPRLVGAEFRAQLAGRMSAEQIDTLVGGLDVRRFLTDAGEPDAEAVAGYVSAIPSAAPAEPAKPARVDLGGGRRDSAPATSGADLWEQRHRKPARTT